MLPVDQPEGSIHVPIRTNVGDPLQIKLNSFDPNATVTLEATATDTRGITYKKVLVATDERSGKSYALKQ